MPSRRTSDYAPWPSRCDVFEVSRHQRTLITKTRTNVLYNAIVVSIHHLCRETSPSALRFGLTPPPLFVYPHKPASRHLEQALPQSMPLSSAEYFCELRFGGCRLKHPQQPPCARGGRAAVARGQTSNRWQHRGRKTRKEITVQLQQYHPARKKHRTTHGEIIMTMTMALSLSLL